MPVSHTNHKGQTYMLYQGKTKTGKPRYYFARSDPHHSEPVAELPAGFTISESVNGVVSLVKDRPSSILPGEIAAIKAQVQRHPKAHHYRVAVKHNRVEVYELVGPDFNEVFDMIRDEGGMPSPAFAEQLQAEDRYAQYSPVLRFTLLDPKERVFGSERMCYLGSIDGWLELSQTGHIEKLAGALIPTLGTDGFYDLY